ncbi:putative membrane protein [Brevibacillus laterosporus GI-9]|uniref:DUF2768 family protein n=1 Tax=Brevibacillus laterosporus TaxID=1465 RepID=UPI000240399C|nr:putative membrane protein [Brevibacillus laterosporus GI-9]
MYIDPMTKMNISLLAIFLMFVCNLLLLFSRKKAGTFLSIILKILAFLMLLIVFGMILIVLLV